MKSPDASRVAFNEDIIGPFVCGLNGVAYVKGQYTAIGNIRNGQLTGGALYEHYTGPAGSVQIHVGGLGNWLNANFLFFAFDYPFNQLKVSKLLGLVDSSNVAAIRFDEHIGFHKEHTIAGAGRDGSDLIVYSMTRDQCRWLRNTSDEQLENSSDT